MQIQHLISSFHTFEEKAIQNRYLPFKTYLKLLKALPPSFDLSVQGFSFLQKPIHRVKWGSGKTKILLWGCMHGNEASATMAFFDLCNYLQHPDFKSYSEALHSKITLYFLPVINPDGMQLHQRRNAQGIDINRDFLAQASPEGILLKNIAMAIRPHFAFNLHNQDALWSAQGTGLPASISLLAPPPNAKNKMPKNRKTAVKILAYTVQKLQSVLPQQMAKWDDTFEPRAFGDNFQQMGISTLLIEGGGRLQDEDGMGIRPYYFATIFTALQAIAHQYEAKAKAKYYHQLPQNDKAYFHLLIKNLSLNGSRMDIGINYSECLNAKKNAFIRTYFIADMGDLQSHFRAYKELDAQQMQLNGAVQYNQMADFALSENGTVTLKFKNGILTTIN